MTVLSRDAEKAGRRLGSGVRSVAWSPTEAGAWYAELDGQDAVVHLAGEQAVGARLDEDKKREIERSRIESTRRVVEAMDRAERRPRVLVCGSAVGYYGPRDPAEALDESAGPGHGFLAELTVAWEAAARGAEAGGARVVRARFGIVLGRDGGALPEMVRPFRMFVGGPIAGGRQVVSWVHIEDVVGALLRCIDDPSIQGAVNVVAPNPVDNRELSRTIGKVLGRPSWLPVPKAALELLFGTEGALPLVTGQRVTPAVLERVGYAFRYPKLREALEEALG